MSGSQQQNQDMKPSYAITSKLLRVVAVLTLQYHGKTIFLHKILYTVLKKSTKKCYHLFVLIVLHNKEVSQTHDFVYDIGFVTLA